MDKFKIEKFGEETKKRAKLVYKFCNLMFQPHECPLWILDEHQVDDVLVEMDDENYISYDAVWEKISMKYGVVLKLKDHFMYFWEFLDYLESEQKRQKTQKLLPKPE